MKRLSVTMFLLAIPALAVATSNDHYEVSHQIRGQRTIEIVNGDPEHSTHSTAQDVTTLYQSSGEYRGQTYIVSDSYRDGRGRKTYETPESYSKSGVLRRIGGDDHSTHANHFCMAMGFDHYVDLGEETWKAKAVNSYRSSRDAWYHNDDEQPYTYITCESELSDDDDDDNIDPSSELLDNKARNRRYFGGEAGNTGFQKYTTRDSYYSVHWPWLYVKDYYYPGVFRKSFRRVDHQHNPVGGKEGRYLYLAADDDGASARAFCRRNGFDPEGTLIVVDNEGRNQWDNKVAVKIEGSRFRTKEDEITKTIITLRCASHRQD